MSGWNSRSEKYLLLLLFLIIVIRNAWVSDDAYITFRVIENFLSGYGLTYNPYVRVQAYTHPTWMFLLSGVYFIERIFVHSSPSALYFIAVFVSITASMLALYFLVKSIEDRGLLAVIFVVASLTFSRAFIDYSTSGLENPLTHLLIALFLWVYFTKPGKLYLLSLISSLLVLNRQDAILLILPSLVYSAWMNGINFKTIKAISLGFLPLIAWELFSIFYYGFPFPNTAYAKLNVGVESSILIQQGMDYLLNSIHWDPLTLFLVALSGGVLFLNRTDLEYGRLRIPYLGVILYIFYIVKIGGDFMSGRFLTAPLFISVALLSRVHLPKRSQLLLIGAISLLGVFSIRSTLLDPELPALYPPSVSWTENSLVFDRNGIADERSVYFFNQSDDAYLGLVEDGFRGSETGSTFAGAQWSYTKTKKVVVDGAIGLRSYVEGPDIYVVDYYALVDPLLARLPTSQKKWRIGHFRRDLPKGYIESLETRENQIEDPDLFIYYAELNSIIQGPVWDWERIIKIWKFNTGQYDYLITRYIDSQAVGK